jgi:hypothetical protein
LRHPLPLLQAQLGLERQTRLRLPAHDAHSPAAYLALRLERTCADRRLRDHLRLDLEPLRERLGDRLFDLRERAIGLKLVKIKFHQSSATFISSRFFRSR